MRVRVPDARSDQVACFSPQGIAGKQFHSNHEARSGWKWADYTPNRKFPARPGGQIRAARPRNAEKTRHATSRGANPARVTIRCEQGRARTRRAAVTKPVYRPIAH